jgi:ribose/xylose/arabinose/galactoside ABC-type transport system permease subunit
VSEYGIFVFLIVLVALSGALSPFFLSRENLSNLVLEMVPLAIVTIGQALVIMTGGLDLSVASVMATAAVIGGAAFSRRAGHHPGCLGRRGRAHAGIQRGSAARTADPVPDRTEGRCHRARRRMLRAAVGSDRGETQ